MEGAAVASRVYRLAGLAPPKVVWAKSPAATARVLDAVARPDKTARPGVIARIWDDPTRWRQAGGTPVDDRLRFEIDCVLAGAGSRVTREGREVWDRAGGPEGDVISAWGDLEAALLWDCYLAVAGIQDRLVRAVLDLLAQVGWAVLKDGLAVLVDRPMWIGRNRRGQAESFDCPAVDWRDLTGASFT
jgi:hypothetical protein